MKVNTQNSRITAEIRAEATNWLIAFSEGEVDAAGRKQFNAWLRTSPEHVRVYLRISAFWQDADRIDREARRDIDALVALAAKETNVVSLQTAIPGRERRSYLRIGIAASVILGVSAAWFAWDRYQRAPTYTTATGEQRTVTLPDGSIVEMNARSRIDVRFVDTERRVDLVEGQAIFKVAKNPIRPFVVHSDLTRIRAVGTRFDVNRNDAATTVTVIEGRVAVRGPPQPAPAGAASEILLGANEQLVIAPRTPAKPRKASIATATAWSEGLLAFDSASLGEVAREFNRQNIKPLTIEDPKLQELRISGVFPAIGAGRITEFLHERFGVRVVETEGEIRILAP